jgi:c-di-GMP-binding flagellar brake protein YcgR
MQRRAFERIPASITVKFYCDNMDYSGTVTNLSENGMFICIRDICFPFDSKFEVVIHLHDKVLNIPVKVSRITKTIDAYDGIGVELLYPPKNYLEFVDSLRASL